jgi:hypothetical protein
LTSLAFSKKITSVEYDDKSDMLIIYFTSNIIKRYSHVPKELYEKFSTVVDKNKFYQLKIEGQYPVD